MSQRVQTCQMLILCGCFTVTSEGSLVKSTGENGLVNSKSDAVAETSVLMQSKQSTDVMVMSAHADLAQVE